MTTAPEPPGVAASDDAPTQQTQQAQQGQGVSPRGVKAVLKKVRQTRPTGPESLDAVIKELRAQRPRANLKLIERAFELAQVAHEGQVRKSGDPFINHPLSVALILTQLGLDEVSIAAGLLHDAVEDTEVTLAQVESEMGFEVAALIDGVTKLQAIKFRTAELSRAENIRKMIVATARDVRVILIKIADRLHNMRTLAPCRPTGGR